MRLEGSPLWAICGRTDIRIIRHSVFSRTPAATSAVQILLRCNRIYDRRIREHGSTWTALPAAPKSNCNSRGYYHRAAQLRHLFATAATAAINFAGAAGFWMIGACGQGLGDSLLTLPV